MCTLKYVFMHNTLQKVINAHICILSFTAGMSLHFRVIFAESFTASGKETTSKQVYTLSADIFGILEFPRQ